MLLAATHAAHFTSPAEQEAYLRRALEAQAGQIRAGEERARVDYVQQQLKLFRDTGNLAFLAECAQTFTATESLRELVPLLDHTNANARLVALDGLARQGAQVAPALPRFIARLADADARVQGRAAEALSGLGTNAAPAVPALVRTLTSETNRPAVQEAVASALGCIGLGAVAALPALDAATQDRDVGVARAAWLAAGRIRNEPPLNCAELRAGGSAVFTGTTGYRALAAVRVRRCPTAETADMLVRLLSVAPPALRIEACAILGELRMESPAVVMALLAAVTDPEPHVAASAATAMAQLPATNAALVPLLADATTAPTSRKAESSAKMLARFGPAAATTAPTMLDNVRRFHGSAHYERTLTCLAVVRASGTNTAAVRADLTALLPENSVVYAGLQSHEAKLVRAALLLALAEVGATSDALPTVVDELANATPSPLLAAAARAAGALPEQHQRLALMLRDLLARPGLDSALNLEELNDPFGHFFFRPGKNSTSIYLETIRALRRFGLGARPALAVLRQRAKDPPRDSPFFPPYQQEASELAEMLTKLP